MRSDEGLRFHAILKKADGSRHTRETDNRRELLDWLDAHRQVGDELLEVGMTASDRAIPAFVGALTYGASRLEAGKQ